MLSQSHSRPARIVLAFLAAVAVACSVGVAPAAAVPAPNETIINVNPLITTGLSLAKVKLTAKGAAHIGSAGIYYPVTNATKMNDKFVGTLKHQGGFELKVGTLRFGFSNLIIKTTAKSPVSGVVDATPVINGVQLPFTIPMSTVTVTSVQKTSTAIIAKYKLAIDPNMAKLINSALNIKLLTPGDAWATVETRVALPTTIVPKSPAPTTPVGSV